MGIEWDELLGLGSIDRTIFRGLAELDVPIRLTAPITDLMLAPVFGTTWSALGVSGSGTGPRIQTGKQVRVQL